MGRNEQLAAEILILILFVVQKWTLCDVGINIVVLYNYMRLHIPSREWLDICCLLLLVLTRPRAFLALGAVESILYCM